MPKKSPLVNTRVAARKDPRRINTVSNPEFGYIPLAKGEPERREAEGQVQFVSSDELPAKLMPYGPNNGDTKKLLESWGFIFGKHLGGDSLFRQAKLPPGWQKVATGHSMWSDIVDAQGRKRCSVFYKAAFWDRDAFLGIVPRYQVDIEYQTEEGARLGKGPRRGRVVEGSTVHFAGEWRDTGDYRGYEACREEAAAWLQAHFPVDMAKMWAQ